MGHEQRYIEIRMLMLWGVMPGFVAFDTFKSLLQDEDGKISGPRTVIAGFGAGITESLLAVTPFESIKTQLYVGFAYSFLFPRIVSIPCFQISFLCFAVLFVSLYLATGSMTASPQNPACVASFMAAKSSRRKAAFADSFEASYRQQQDRPPIRPRDSQATRP
jgi:hypothetical protein